MHRAIVRRQSTRAAVACSVAVLVLLLLPSCGGCTSCDEALPVQNGPVLAQAPHFLLEDLNDSSLTYTQQVSPRAYIGGISAWYFGHAT